MAEDTGSLGFQTIAMDLLMDAKVISQIICCRCKGASYLNLSYHVVDKLTS